MGYLLALLVGGGAGYGLKNYIDENKEIEKQSDTVGQSETKNTVPLEKSSSNKTEESKEKITAATDGEEGSFVAVADATLPAADSPDEVVARLHESFREIVLDRQKKELEKFDAKAEIDSASGEAKSIHGKTLPPKTLEEATEVIVLLEALNRGLMAHAYEDQTSYRYKQKIFEQLTPVFIGETDRMLKKLKDEMEIKQKSDLDNLESEFYKNLVIQLEQQKHKLFTDYQARAKAIEEDYSKKLKATAVKLKADYDASLSDTQDRFEKYRQERMQKLNEMKTTAGALQLMLEHAVEAQKRSKQVWELSLCLIDVQEAIKGSAEPFAKQWEALLDASKGDPVLETAITSVPAEVVVSGVSNRGELTSRFFKKVESATREGALIDKAKPALNGSAPPTIWGYVLARVTSLFLVPQRTLVEGNRPEDIISRAGYYLSHGDLDGCTKELESLRGEPAELAKDWISAAKDRLLLENTLNIVKTRMAHLDVTPLKFKDTKK